MAKPGLQIVTTSNTFQGWLDRTNEIVNIIKSETITASVAGDTTGSIPSPLNATLIGTFTANNVVVSDLIRADNISSKIGSSSIMINAQITANTALQTAAIFKSTLGARTTYASDSTNWLIGYENTSTNSFVIDNGVGSTKLVLTTNGNLRTLGSITAGTGGFIGDITGNVTGNVAGNVTGNVAGDVTGNLTGNVTGNLTGNVTGNLTGNVTGDVSGNSSTVTNGVYTIGNQTIGGVKTFTDTIVGSISGNAATVTNGVYTIGAQIINGGKTFSSNLTVSNTNPRLIFSDTDGQNFSISVNSNLWNILSNSGASVLSVNQSGSLIASGDVTAFSDIRTKKNISTIERALEKTLSLRGVEFTRTNDEKETKKIGMIAQEVEKILPEAVSTNEDGYKAIAYGNIVGLLIEAIKDLNKELEELKNSRAV
jgi:hypothetical protein